MKVITVHQEDIDWLAHQCACGKDPAESSTDNHHLGLLACHRYFPHLLITTAIIASIVGCRISSSLIVKFYTISDDKSVCQLPKLMIAQGIYLTAARGVLFYGWCAIIGKLAAATALCGQRFLHPNARMAPPAQANIGRDTR